MKTISVSFSLGNVPVKEKIVTDLQWYDVLKKEMMHFKGGRLDFEYRECKYLKSLSESEREKIGYKTAYRMLPKVKDLEGRFVKQKSNKEEIEKWFSKYLNYNSSEISIGSKSSEEIEFNVPDDEIDDFTSELYRQRFDFSVD